jgi:hypothetical protein
MRRLCPFTVFKARTRRVYQVIRDYFVFTNKRLIRVDVQGVTGRTAEYITQPLQRHPPLLQVE